MKSLAAQEIAQVSGGGFHVNMSALFVRMQTIRRSREKSNVAAPSASLSRPLADAPAGK
ncbi:hypothetical protein [Chitinimonas sp. BJB300]|uniref:hypothetical protein n=1 Tax=Chitinimonas sp. BJB300 TaxID=1559339 RepID=UPI00130453B0|nr:hypothetical protein [Chitinimonas sp. BJB300]